MAEIPERIRQALLDRGATFIEIGDLCLELKSGTITRPIILDEVEIARPVFPSAEIDWEIVADALEIS